MKRGVADNMGGHNKLTHEFIQEWCENNNIEFLDKCYISNKTKHKWRCVKHEETHPAMFHKIQKRGKLNCCKLLYTTVLWIWWWSIC